MYKGESLGLQRIDMIVDGKIIVETKSTYELHQSARRQVFNYLRATNLDVGLLLHFGPKAAFYRRVRSFPLKKIRSIRIIRQIRMNQPCPTNNCSWEKTAARRDSASGRSCLSKAKN